MRLSILFWIAAAAAALLFASAVLHMLLLGPRKKANYNPAEDEERALLYAGKLSKMLQCDTVSDPDETDPEKFRHFHSVLEELFPHVFASLKKTEADGNLLLYWKGRKDSRPIVLMSHMDTVPVEGEWKYPPFSGMIAQGRVWGRGACDTKCSVMGFFQAVEELLAEGYIPEQDIYLSSSCTEETGGGGCAKLADVLEGKGVRPWLVCDEGGAIMKDPLPGIHGSFAMIGVMEKGSASLDFIADSDGGHASTPQRHSPIARLADFIHHVEHHDPFKRRMPEPVRRMMRELAPYGTLPVRFVFSNLWLFGPLVARVMPSVSAKASAMLKTTIAFTVQSGSRAYNVIPERAVAGANMRFIPHEPMKESLEKIRRIAARYGLKMEVLHSEDVSMQADIDSEASGMLIRVIRKTFPGVGVSPYILTGGTDARIYEKICPNVLRFAPVVFGPEEKHGIHGIDESIPYSVLPGCVDFYRNLIRASADSVECSNTRESQKCESCGSQTGRI